MTGPLQCFCKNFDGLGFQEAVTGKYSATHPVTNSTISNVPACKVYREDMVIGFFYGESIGYFIIFVNWAL